MPFDPGDKAFSHNHLHHAGTILPDGTASLGDVGGDITGYDNFYPFPAASLAFRPTLPILTDQAAADTGGAASGVSLTAPAAQAGGSASSGLVIDATYDSTITNLATSNPTEYSDITGAINAAITFYQDAITSQITINIDFGFGEVAGGTLLPGALGESEAAGNFQLYSSVLAELTSSVTSADDKTSVASLPASDPTPSGNFFVGRGELKALGVIPGNSGGIDGYVGLSSTSSFTYDPSNRAVSGKYDAIGVMEHEISEVMGRLESLGTIFGPNEYTPLDLFRYSSAGTRDLTKGPGYFSIDSGTTDLVQFNDPTHGGDAGDLASSVTHDSYDAASSIGVANTVSATDLRMMDVLGYTLAPVAAGPTITAGGTVTFTGGGAAVTLDSGLAVADASSTTQSSGTVTIGGFIAGDTLTVGTPGGLGTSFSNGTLTLSGTASTATYQTALDSIAYSFNPANGDPTGGGSHTSRAISWSVNDGAASSNAGSSTLDTVHAAPTITTSGTVAFTQGGAAIALDSGLAVADPDSNGDISSATVAVAGGVFASDGDTLAGNTTGTAIIANYTAATETLTLTGTDTIANYQAVLRSITFSSTGATAGSRTIDWTLNDGVGTSTTSTSGVTVHDQPAVTASGTVTFTGGGSAVTLDTGLTVVDVSSPTLSSGTVIIGGFITGDTLTVGTPGGLGTSFSNGTLTLSGGASLGTYQTALDSVTYSFTPATGDPTGGGSHTSRAISWSVNDGVAASNAGSSTLDTVHAAPTITTGGTTVTFDLGGTAIALDSGLAVADPDSNGDISSATVAVAGGVFSSDGDTLAGTTTGTAIIATYTAATETLTLTGTDTLADYQAVLRSVTFSSTGATAGSRTIDWTLNDGVSTSATSTSSVTLSSGGPACYCLGTRILTDRGDLAVEDLRIGDRVVTRSGTARAIKWIGDRRIDCRRHPDPRQVWPVRIVAGAFGPDQPSRDLLLSPDHAVAIDGALVPIKLLVNDASIRQETGQGNVHYFHIELDRHDLLLADGLLAESYLDTGNRGLFANADAPFLLHPRLEQRDGQVLRETLSCLPFRCEPADVEPLWRSLAARAEGLGLAPPEAVTTDDPALCIVAGARRFAPVLRDGGRYTFMLPALPSGSRLRSRCAVPAAARPWLEDRRQLGVMVRRLSLHSGAEQIDVALDDPRLAQGWWATERDAAAMWRWTDGDAALPPTDGPAIVELWLGGTLSYPVVAAIRAEQMDCSPATLQVA